jgi:hypothetical protein
MANSPDRKTAKPLPTLAGVEPLYLHPGLALPRAAVQGLPGTWRYTAHQAVDGLRNHLKTDPSVPGPLATILQVDPGAGLGPVTCINPTTEVQEILPEKAAKPGGKPTPPQS